MKMSDFFANSPDILRFWVDAYRGRLEKSPSNMEMQRTMEFYERSAVKESRPSGEDFNMEDDLRRSRDISGKCKSSATYSQNLYAALCNNRFRKMEREWTCSWRQAGGIVAHLCERGDYMDWYCSGLSEAEGHVHEGTLTDEVRHDLSLMGWSVH